MKEILKKIKRKAMVYTIGLMEENMMVFGKIANNMVKEYIIIKKVKCLKVIGRKVNE